MDLNRIIKKVLMEEESRSNRYMFFSNLQQMKRQCEMLLEMDQDEIESILENGHDWAQDHIAEAKNNMDQVFDFLKNETEGESDYEEKEDNDDEEDMVMVEGRRKEEKKEEKKREHLFVLEVLHLQNQNMTYIQVHTPMVMLFKYVKARLKVLMVKNIVRGLIVKGLIKYF
jgi:hypothetical protein